MKNLRLRVLLLGGTLFLSSAALYAVMCGTDGAVACGSACVRLENGNCVCGGECTKEELDAISSL